MFRRTCLMFPHNQYLVDTSPVWTVSTNSQPQYIQTPTRSCKDCRENFIYADSVPQAPITALKFRYKMRIPYESDANLQPRCGPHRSTFDTYSGLELCSSVHCNGWTQFPQPEKECCWLWGSRVLTRCHTDGDDNLPPCSDYSSHLQTSFIWLPGKQAYPALLLW